MSRPSLRVVDGLRERAQDAEMETTVMRDEARAHIARMRLTLQMRFWDAEPWSAVRRPLLAELDRYARKFDEKGAA